MWRDTVNVFMADVQYVLQVPFNAIAARLLVDIYRVCIATHSYHLLADGC